ncbi:CDGSH iron-sulfur domain-containing protein 3, mitochondrial [Dromaius novaehollandiae]|uniref:CDGSH iron-sulfur domain-containing protein 3, mitochondrial n=1 Tax=Dromaius novaehollandiae TaxID=8790 RepID=UPI00311FDD26
MAPLRPGALVTAMRAAAALLQGGGAGGGGGGAGGLSPPRAQAEPVAAAEEPFAVELKAGRTYAWCACGHSKKQPFCDGAHKRAAPGVTPLRFTPDADGRARLCGCKRTRSPPFCDGSHRRDPGRAAPPP